MKTLIKFNLSGFAGSISREVVIQEQMDCFRSKHGAHMPFRNINYLPIRITSYPRRIYSTAIL